MPKFRFDEIAVNSTEKKKPVEEDKYTYLGLEHLDTGSLTVTRFGSDVAPIGEKLVMKKGDVLFGKRRAYQKKVAIAPFDGIFSAHGMVLRPKEDVIDKDFFPLFISSDYFLDAAIKISVGSLSPTINWRDLKVLEFELPPLEEQRKLAKTLWAVIRTIEAYKELLKKTDELVKSQFIEAFGDPHDNPFGWKACKLQDVMAGKASNGFFAKPTEYKDDGNSGIICVGDVVNRKYSNTVGLRRVDADEKDISRFCVRYGDLLFCRSSLVKEGIAKASIVPHDTPDNTLFECHVIRIPLDTSIVIPEFMQEFTYTDYFRTQMMNKSKTATMTTIGQKDIITGDIYVPDIMAQKKFMVFAEQTDKSKFELTQALEALNATYKKLISENLG